MKLALGVETYSPQGNTSSKISVVKENLPVNKLSFSHQVWGSVFFFSTGVGDHFSFLSSVDDMTLLMALMFQ
jgi:hypothetical protein